ncbi:Penicillin-binding protein activator LpoA [Alphaproteobacteria bacterium SO-S41]|nr:Penicillin-binding protein activator LpoA [Alphaproteobacteria bacterium SO-S41]
MALAPTLPSWSFSGSGLARRLKAICSAALIVLGAAALSGCQTAAEPGQGTVLEPGSGGPGGPGRGPRPNVNPLGPEGPVASGAPRRPGGIGMGPVKIALLVPQSGRGKDLGNPLFDAAQMALFDTGRNDITLIVKNTSNGAGNAAQQAINEGAEIILGPVFAEDVAAVRAVAAPLGIPVISFSSTSSAAGGGVYLLSFTPEEEIRAVVNYAASRGMGLFAVMSPNDTYAVRATATFQRDVAATGGQIVANAAYNAGGPVYSSVMQLDNKDFDAIFVPGGGKGLQNIAKLIRFGPPPPPPPPAPPPLTDEQIKAGVAPPPAPPPPPPPPRAVLPEYVLLGTGLWDESGNGSAGGLTGGLFAAPEPSTRQSFSARFEGIYNYRPPRVASLGYDAMSLAATLSDNLPGQRFTQSAITDPNGFGGVDGIFRFLPNGTIQRGLAIIGVTGGGFTVIKPAPRSFQDTGS